MYQTGDKVVYGTHGVCLVADLEEREVDHKQVIYLVLEPLGQQGSRYMVPTHNAAAMAKVKPMLNRDALESLLESETIREDAWILDENKRKQCYRELITSGDRQKLIQMVNSLYRHRRTQIASGRRFISAMKTSCGMRKNSWQVRFLLCWTWSPQKPCNISGEN